MFKRTTFNLTNLMVFFICVPLHIFVKFKFFYRYSNRKTFDKQKGYIFFSVIDIETIWMINLAIQICVKNISFSKQRIVLNLSYIKNPPTHFLNHSSDLLNNMSIRGYRSVNTKNVWIHFINTKDKQTSKQRTTIKYLHVLSKCFK